ncbi:MAG TPA: DinB family protein [Mycobacteriales bacterium]|nr:DinB family protein [Mycobacteriales bacterium]
MSDAEPDTAPIEPDTKDWTWVLERPCPDCGFDAASLAREQIGPQLLAAAAELGRALGEPGATSRPAPGVWSPTEYACHVRDVCRVFGERLLRMLTEDEPAFANWDQDATARELDYAAQDPEVVARQLRAEATTLAGAWDAVPPDAWDRRGLRSDGAAFTVLSLGRYLEHDLVHHVHDVQSGVRA